MACASSPRRGWRRGGTTHPVIPESSPPTCPTCAGPLAKRPKAKTRCRHCSAFIYVRSRPADGRWLLAESELPQWERQSEEAARRRAAVSALWQDVHVVGESFKNPDGTSRQALIRTRSRVGATVQLVPEPDNPHDPNAVKVCLETGEQLGYVSSEDAHDLANERRTGYRHAAIIHRVIGGTPDKPSRGVLLRMISAPPGTSEAEIMAAVESALTEPDLWEENQASRAASATSASSQWPHVAITLDLEERGRETPGSYRRWLWVLLVLFGGVMLVYLLVP
jgi:hypothetical protein